MILQPEPHVPHVVTAEIPGERGRVIVCVPDDEPTALVMLERDGLSIHTEFGQGALRRAAAALLEAADRVATAEPTAGPAAQTA